MTNCKGCGISFYVTRRPKQIYCTRECYFSVGVKQRAPRKQPLPAPTFMCPNCKEVKERVYRGLGRGYNLRNKYCSKECAAVVHSATAQWTLTPQGYVLKRRNGQRFVQHRILMEELIGRKLKRTETVHHKNGNRSDNRIENLELWDSRHGKGQRVTDKINFAKEFLADYGYTVDLNVPYPAG